MLLAQTTEIRRLSPVDMQVLASKPGAWMDTQTRLLMDRSDFKGVVYSGTFTDSTIDRYRSVVHSEGGQTANWERNPVVYLEHGWMMGDLPIGRGIALIKEPTSMESAFMLATGDPQSTRAANLIDQVIMRSLSLSWRTITAHEEVMDDIDSDGKAVKRPVVHHDTWEMREYSVVGMPGNVNMSDMHGVNNARYETAVLEARALSARLFELVSREDVDQPTMRKVCGRVLSLYGLTPDDAEIANRAIDFQCEFGALVHDLPPESLQRALLSEALCACINNPFESPDPVTADQTAVVTP